MWVSTNNSKGSHYIFPPIFPWQGNIHSDQISQGSFPDCHLFVKYNLDYCCSEGNWLWSFFCFISLEMMKCSGFQNEDGHLILKQSNYCSITRHSESIYCPAARTPIQNKPLISQIMGREQQQSRADTHQESLGVFCAGHTLRWASSENTAGLLLLQVSQNTQLAQGYRELMELLEAVNYNSYLIFNSRSWSLWHQRNS